MMMTQSCNRNTIELVPTILAVLAMMTTAMLTKMRMLTLRSDRKHNDQNQHSKAIVLTVIRMSMAKTPTGNNTLAANVVIQTASMKTITKVLPGFGILINILDIEYLITATDMIKTIQK